MARIGNDQSEGTRVQVVRVQSFSMVQGHGKGETAQGAYLLRELVQ